MELHEAAEEGDQQRVANLLAAGADLKHQDDEGNTALHIACGGEGDPETVRYAFGPSYQSSRIAGP